MLRHLRCYLNHFTPEKAIGSNGSKRISRELAVYGVRVEEDEKKAEEEERRGRRRESWRTEF